MNLLYDFLEHPIAWTFGIVVGLMLGWALVTHIVDREMKMSQENVEKCKKMGGDILMVGDRFKGCLIKH